MDLLREEAKFGSLLGLLIFLTVDLMVLGAGVRALDAGLTCPYWPLCFGKVIPAMHVGVWLEFIHRVIAGFVAGSLLIIWPWKDQVPKTDGDGQIIVKTAERELVGRPGSLVEVKAAAVKADEEVMIAGYENWHLPSFSSSETWLALVLLVAGAGMVVMMEMLSRQKSGAEEGEK